MRCDDPRAAELYKQAGCTVEDDGRLVKIPEHVIDAAFKTCPGDFTIYGREGKNDVNARIANRGLGFDLRTEHPTSRQLARAADRVLGDDRIRRNVAEIQAQLSSYDPMEIIASHLFTEPTVRA